MIRVGSTFLGIVFIIFGVLVLAFPDLLRWLVAIFFIVAGIFTIAGMRSPFRR